MIISIIIISSIIIVTIDIIVIITINMSVWDLIDILGILVLKPCRGYIVM